jgi:hypothetical protein
LNEKQTNLYWDAEALTLKLSSHGRIPKMRATRGSRDC